MATRDIVGILNSDDFLLREQCSDAKWCTKVY